MASGLPWFKFDADAHSHPKLRALKDAEFRLITYIWALARRSTVPGHVYVTEKVGVPPEELAAGAGCDWARERGRRRDAPERALRRFEALALITRDENGVIEVHDWEEHNGYPPSREPENRSAQKRKERAGKRGVARMSPDQLEMCRQDVATPEVEVEEEGEQKKIQKQPPARSDEKRIADAPDPEESTGFVLFVQAEWPDLRTPAQFEKRARAAFPAVDPLVEARKARGWELSDASRRKRSHGKFLWGWLGRSQDNAARLGAGSGPPTSLRVEPVPPQRKAEIDRLIAKGRA